MPYELYLRHYSRAGVLKNAVLEPLRVRFTESVSGQEPLVFTLDANHPAIDTIDEYDILEVMMRNRELGLVNFTRAFVGIQRHWSFETDDDGLQVIEFTAPNEKHILSWRHVLWYANTVDRSSFQAAKGETVMKNVVKYNLTSLATTAAGRLRAGDLAPGMGLDITVAADALTGNVISVAFMGANVLATLQKLVELAGGDFSFVWQGLNDWTFDFHLGQLGVDKSTGADRVLFSTENNTMIQPRLNFKAAVATTAVAAGKGDDDVRLMTLVNGPDYAANNDLETFVDARNEDTAEGRTFRGALALEADRSHAELTFDVLQTANQFYSPIAVMGRKTYHAGDLVLASYGGEWVRKIESVSVDWSAPNRGDAMNTSITTREVPNAS